MLLANQATAHAYSCFWPGQSGVRPRLIPRPPCSHLVLPFLQLGRYFKHAFYIVRQLEATNLKTRIDSSREKK